MKRIALWLVLAFVALPIAIGIIAVLTAQFWELFS